MIYGSSMNLLDCRVGTYLLHDDTGKSEIGRGQVGGDGGGLVAWQERVNISGQGRATGRGTMVHETAVVGAANTILLT